MKALVVYAHPVEDSFCSALHESVLNALRDTGHEVVDVDLYAEDFDPRLSRQERIDYHDEARNQRTMREHIDRLMAAEAVVFVFPTWSFGLPAILKGWLDRLLMPGVGFTFGADGHPVPNLRHIQHVVGVSTYGGPRLRAMLVVGDLSRKQIMNYFGRLCGFRTRRRYYALYDMNNADEARRNAFLAKVDRAIRKIK